MVSGLLLAAMFQMEIFTFKATIEKKENNNKNAALLQPKIIAAKLDLMIMRILCC